MPAARSGGSRRVDHFQVVLGAEHRDALPTVVPQRVSHDIFIGSCRPELESDGLIG